LQYEDIINKIWYLFNVPSKTIMGMCTLSMLVFCYCAVFMGVQLPSNVLTFYGVVLTAYATSTTITTVKGMSKDSKSETEIKIDNTQ
jgi:membrane protein DedA with SNARE-associated domain